MPTSVNALNYPAAARLRLFCIGGAGQNSSLFAAWRNEFPQDVEVCPLELPGRLQRYRERPVDNLPDLLSLLSKEITPLLNIPFAFFGHSMGALVAFELSRALRKGRLPQPVHLFSSGCSAPQHVQTGIPFAAASDKHFTQQLLTMGMIEPDVTRNPALLQIILPVMRADLKLCQTYQYKHEPPFHFPISAYCGRREYWLCHQAIAWKSQTTGPFQMRIFDGNHHYLRDNYREVIRHLCQALISKEVPVKT